MRFSNLKNYFRGEEGWMTLNRIIICGSYSSLIMCLIILPLLIGWVILGLTIILLYYAYLYEHHKREIVEKELEKLKHKLKEE